MIPDLTVLAYIGPETILPVTSVLAAVGGALLMGGRYVRLGFVWCLKTVTGRKSDAS